MCPQQSEPVKPVFLWKAWRDSS